MAKECEVTSKTYKEIRVLPAALRSSGAMEQYNKTLGFFITDSLRTAAGIHIPNKEATLIIDAEIVTVTKKSGEIWAAGEAIFWLSATTEFTNVDDGNGLLVGKAKDVAASGSATGDIVFRDYYPVQRGMQIGTVSVPYKIIVEDPMFAAHMTVGVGGSLVGLDFSLRHTLDEAVVPPTGGYSTSRIIRSVLRSNVQTGIEATCFYGQIDYEINGRSHGEATVIRADIKAAASNMAGGAYYPFYSRIEVPIGGTWMGPGSAYPFAFFKCGLRGSGKGEFDTEGYLFHIDGVTAEADGFYDDGVHGVVDGFLKIRINGNDAWILIANDCN